MLAHVFWVTQEVQEYGCSQLDPNSVRLSLVVLRYFVTPLYISRWFLCISQKHHQTLFCEFNRVEKAVCLVPQSKLLQRSLEPSQHRWEDADGSRQSKAFHVHNSFGESWWISRECCWVSQFWRGLLENLISIEHGIHVCFLVQWEGGFLAFGGSRRIFVFQLALKLCSLCEL